MNKSLNLWRVEVQGSPSDLEYLVGSSVAPSGRFSIGDRGEGYFYESDSFSNCSSEDEILKIAAQELCVLSGVLKWTRYSPEKLRAVAVFRRNATGGRDVFLNIHDEVQVREELRRLADAQAEATCTVTTSSERLPGTSATAWLAANDLSVAKTMRLLVAPDHKSWVGMYRIYEVIAEDVGGERLLKTLGWCLAVDISRFKHSANSAAVGGDTARHGSETKRPPSHPMSIDEAWTCVNSLIDGWLLSKWRNTV